MLTGVNTDNVTSPPLQVRTPTITHSQLQAHIDPGYNDLQIRNQGNPGEPSPPFVVTAQTYSDRPKPMSRKSALLH